MTTTTTTTSTLTLGRRDDGGWILTGPTGTTIWVDSEDLSRAAEFLLGGEDLQPPCLEVTVKGLKIFEEGGLIGRISQDHQGGYWQGKCEADGWDELPVRGTQQAVLSWIAVVSTELARW